MKQATCLQVSAVLACGLLGGCALLSKNAPLEPRYFTLEDPAEGGAASAAHAAVSGVALALGRVSGGAQLRERIVFRQADHEVGYYDDRRWTERPEEYLRRALANALFEERGFTRVVSGAAPVLEAELLSFEEIRGDKPRVRMQVMVTLADARVARLNETITVERPVAEASGDKQANAAVAAFAEALHAGVEQIADHVGATLQAQSPAQ